MNGIYPINLRLQMGPSGTSVPKWEIMLAKELTKMEIIEMDMKYNDEISGVLNVRWNALSNGGLMIKHFVIFFSPGTFVAETTEKPIDSWDVTEAVNIARNIKERYRATPYGFCFTTRERNDDELDSKEIKRSGTYFLGGKVLTIDDLKGRNDPKDRILISNMEVNHWDKIVENCNSWKWTQPLREGDEFIDFSV